MSKEFISVTVLNNYIKSMVNAEDMLQNIVLVGEVSGIRCSGAHSYFAIKDENAQIDCCCFNYLKTYLPKSGECVFLKGGVDFYSKNGKLTFIAKSIEPQGQGALAIRLEQLKKQLADKGLFSEKYKIAIPNFCKKVCVITSKTGAVIRDIVTTIRRKNDLLTLHIYDVKVQGDSSSEQIISAIKDVDNLGYDAIIIARGGGSLEDLMPFNSEKLVYAIFEAKTPIISAVGHETDFTLCDFVADLRVPTPTAAAEAVAFDKTVLLNSIKQLDNKMANQMFQSLKNANITLKASLKNLISANRVKYVQNATKITTFGKTMTNLINIRIQTKVNDLTNVITKIDNNNPTKILKQGYYKVFNIGGSAVEIKDITIGESINVYGAGGSLWADVTKINLIEKD